MSDPIIQLKDLSFSYIRSTEKGSERVEALKGVTLDIERGSFTAVVGKNGSGKSTLAKCLNALLLPTEGEVLVDGMSTCDQDKVWDIRQKVGMVFQNPDNQLVAAIVEDDVAFGPENLGVMPEEIRQRVDSVLTSVGMEGYRDKAPHHLSGGQKQKIAIAGALAMQPECIVFDEPTAMLDPQGRKDIMDIIRSLHDRGTTVILITHFMDEAAEADRIIVMDEGSAALDGPPQEIFRKTQDLLRLGMTVPLAVELAERLRKNGIRIPYDIISLDQLTQVIHEYK